MARPLPEDIAALCSHAGIDSSNYKDFTAQRNAAAAVSTPVPEAGKNAATMPTSASTASASAKDAASAGELTAAAAVAAPGAIRVHLPGGEASQPPGRVETMPVEAGPTGRIMHNLVELPLPTRHAFAMSHSSAVAAEMPRNHPDRWAAIEDVFSLDASPRSEAAAPSLPAGSISIFATGGGMGKNTVAATLARVLTGLGESILLAGLTADSILPLYFGARTVSGGVLRSFLVPREQGRGSLHLYLDSAAAGSEGAAAETELLERVREQAEMVKDDLDRAILVCPNGGVEPLAPVLRSTSLRLGIIVPDLASALGVNRMLRSFRESEDWADAPYFVLNKFVASRALHQEMRSRLQEQLGDRLLPLVIRRSDDVQDALAAGMTVLDYAAESPIAQDFVQLAEWIRRHSTGKNEGNKNGPG